NVAGSRGVNWDRAALRRSKTDKANGPPATGTSLAPRGRARKDQVKVAEGAVRGRYPEIPESRRRDCRVPCDKMPGERLAQARRIPLAGRPLPRGIPIRVRENEQRGRAAQLLRARQLGAPPGDRVRGPGIRAAGGRRRRVVDF